MLQADRAPRYGSGAMRPAIQFYLAGDEHGDLSNFAREQHAELAAMLLATGDAKLVERTENDAYWGDGGDGSGRNMLGRILEEVRAELRDRARDR